MVQSIFFTKFHFSENTLFRKVFSLFYCVKKKKNQCISKPKNLFQNDIDFSVNSGITRPSVAEDLRELITIATPNIRLQKL